MTVEVEGDLVAVEVERWILWLCKLREGSGD